MLLKKILAFLLLALCCLATEQTKAATDQMSLDGVWKIATDADNSGRDKKWSQQVSTDAVECNVPWILQGTFPDYNGLAWYWREFEVPESFQNNGRYLLHFEQVDYYGEIWLNGTLVGKHEGGETPFTIDVTEAIARPGKNFLAVRVLNPTDKEIDGILFIQTPRRCKKFPFINAGGSYNHGGITGSVRLEAVPSVYVDDVYVDARIDGRVSVQVTVNNASGTAQQGTLDLGLSDGRNGDTVVSQSQPETFPVGFSTQTLQTRVDNPRLWQLNSPALYRATVRLATDSITADSTAAKSTAATKAAVFSEKSARFGFRDFRFENGYFRLNGKRIFVKSTHTVNNYPIGLQFPHDPDLWRRDLLNLKAMGFNMVRFIWGASFPEQLDYCDEIGLMVYNEPYTSHDMQDSPYAYDRWHNGLAELIKRDRNHPSIVIWGLLNEIQAHSVIFKFAVESLPFVRQFDSSRAVMLNSGRWDLWSSNGMDKRILLWSEEEQDPFVGKNPTKELIQVLGINWLPGRVALHPGPQNEFSVARWTAPENGTLNLSATFEGFAEKATTDVHIFLRGKSLFDSVINLNGQENSTSFEQAGIEVTAGDTIDFIVGSGNQNYGGDSTGLTAQIVMNNKKWDIAEDFVPAPDANSCWTYGVLPATEVPEVTKFAPYSYYSSRRAPNKAGTVSNPDSIIWEDIVQDTHPYQRVPHTADVVQFLRTTQGYAPESGQPLFLTEYGIGSAVDLIRTMRFFEEFNAENLCDAKYYNLQLQKYYADWDKWHLDQAFDRPEDFFAQSIAKMASQRTIGLSAIRSNPAIVGHSVTGCIDQVLTGEGLTTPFREMKPGTIDAMFEAWSPLLWSVFAEPIHLYRGNNLHLEAVLSNEDMLKPGTYPARAEIFDANGKRVYSKSFDVVVDAPGEKEPPFAKLCFKEDTAFDFPTGTYRFVTTLERGGAVAGGEVQFYVTDKADMPKVTRPVLFWNEDPDFMKWCAENGISITPAKKEAVSKDSLIIVTDGPDRPGCDSYVLDAAIRSGATTLFLTPKFFDNETNQKIFLADKGTFSSIYSWLYQKDEWSKIHPFFTNMPSGGLMNNQYYRELIPDICLHDTTPPDLWPNNPGTVRLHNMTSPAEAVAGAIKASQDYESGLMLAVYPCQEGHIILSTFLIRESRDINPAAELLLKNILNNAP